MAGAENPSFPRIVMLPLRLVILSSGYPELRQGAGGGKGQSSVQQSRNAVCCMLYSYMCFVFLLFFGVFFVDAAGRAESNGHRGGGP